MVHILERPGNEQMRDVPPVVFILSNPGTKIHGDLVNKPELNTALHGAMNFYRQQGCWGGVVIYSSFRRF